MFADIKRELRDYMLIGLMILGILLSALGISMSIISVAIAAVIIVIVLLLVLVDGIKLNVFKTLANYTAIKKIDRCKGIISKRIGKLENFTDIIKNKYSKEDFDLQKSEYIRVVSQGLKVDAMEVKESLENKDGTLHGRINRELEDLNKAYKYMDNTERFLVDNNYAGNRKVVKAIHKKFMEYASNVDNWDNERILSLEMNIK